MIGNAVPVNLATALAKVIKEDLKRIGVVSMKAKRKKWEPVTNSKRLEPVQS